MKAGKIAKMSIDEIWLLGFHLIEHSSVAIKDFEDFGDVRIVALSDKRDILCSCLSLDFGGADNVMLLLFGAIEPSQEKACPLCLLATLVAAQIKQDIRIDTEELFNNTDYRLGNLGVTGRLRMIWVRQIEPINHKERIIFLVKCDYIFDVMVGSKCKRPEISATV